MLIYHHREESVKTYESINDRIRRGKAAVVTAVELDRLIKEKGIRRTARKVDVVTTGTFGAMCSSGVFLNFGHASPRIRATRVWINGVEAYAGIAAVDCYLGATRRCRKTENGRLYGGGHVIHDLAAGKPVHLKALSDGSDCYPRKVLEKTLTLDAMGDAILFSPRNGYQNYVCAVNSGTHRLETYMGVLEPRFGNAHYSGAGCLSPLMKDPFCRVVGVGTRIFLGGGVGTVTGPGTQFACRVPRTEHGLPTRPAATLAVTGDLKRMDPRWLLGTAFRGYGTTLRVGLGIPIPVLNEEVLVHASARDEQIRVPVVDFAEDYPMATGRILAEVSYADLRNGSFYLNGKTIPAFGLSSRRKALEIAGILRQWIRQGSFLLGKPVAPLYSGETA